MMSPTYINLQMLDMRTRKPPHIYPLHMLCSESSCWCLGGWHLLIWFTQTLEIRGLDLADFFLFFWGAKKTSSDMMLKDGDLPWHNPLKEKKNITIKTSPRRWYNWVFEGRLLSASGFMPRDWKVNWNHAQIFPQNINPWISPHSYSEDGIETISRDGSGFLQNEHLMHLWAQCTTG